MRKKQTLRHRYSAQEKAEITLEILRETHTLAELASTHGVHVNQLRRWRAQALERFALLFDDEQHEVRELQTAHEHEREQLYAQIGRLTTELDWLKKKGGGDHAPR
jgi:transposase-like protein